MSAATKSAKETAWLLRAWTERSVRAIPESAYEDMMAAASHLDETAEALTASRAEAEALRAALEVNAAILSAEMTRSGGAPFTGTWSIPSLSVRVTCSDALDMANAALAREDTP